jgi:hypothetical protein
VPAAVGTAATVGAADRSAPAAVEVASTAEATADRTASNWTALREPATSVEAASAIIEATSAIAIIEAAPKTVEPRASADEHAADEVVRAPVAVRRARVRVSRIVAVSANGSRTKVSRAAEPDADYNSLCGRV